MKQWILSGCMFVVFFSSQIEAKPVDPSQFYTHGFYGVASEAAGCPKWVKRMPGLRLELSLFNGKPSGITWWLDDASGQEKDVFRKVSSAPAQFISTLTIFGEQPRITRSDVRYVGDSYREQALVGTISRVGGGFALKLKGAPASRAIPLGGLDQVVGLLATAQAMAESGTEVAIVGPLGTIGTTATFFPRRIKTLDSGFLKAKIELPKSCNEVLNIQCDSTLLLSSCYAQGIKSHGDNLCRAAKKLWTDVCLQASNKGLAPSAYEIVCVPSY